MQAPINRLATSPAFLVSALAASGSIAELPSVNSMAHRAKIRRARLVSKLPSRVRGAGALLQPCVGGAGSGIRLSGSSEMTAGKVTAAVRKNTARSEI